ncbi:MAG: hypothetical protein JWO70_1789 [Betaproteobacteria bacterium]|nr:hypothetical protein [Betaproteobacteria bacterium]
MNAERKPDPKTKPDEPVMSLEELAKRMLEMPVETRDQMTHKKEAKPPKRK